MNKNFKKTVISFVFLSILTPQISSAKETTKFVFCATKEAKWNWLKDGCGNIITVKGIESFSLQKTEKTNYYQEKQRKVKYFKVTENDPENVIKEFQLNCINQFGAEYKLAQPAANIFSPWYPFGLSDDKIAPGIFILRESLNLLGIPISTIGVNSSDSYMNLDQLWHEAHFSQDSWKLNPPF
ncbi:hypothetical protein QEJ31_02640 [Pigmentibacter sp. JX0631]|uniref:hypothetical protein n=1 Tax=Pigmentibacter sp. JX0631 TaxID=2976982 RepID=UPI00246845C1|nr:hypothetical protein [Pigmentibacter sp. JX0631]WGL60499.1 hypothetical protein QEJ31_02640 [Pigmentibacter sp. JX0631]